MARSPNRPRRDSQRPKTTMTPTTTGGGLRGLLDQLDALHAAGETALLGIVVATEGSTYQKRGALVLLDRNGLRHGVISGGCLEPELERRARDVFAGGRAAIADFDTRSDEDLVFGSGTGCRGRVHLLLLPQPPQAPLARALHQAVTGSTALSVRLQLGGLACGAGSAHVAAVVPPPGWHWDAAGVAAEAVDAGDFEWTIASPPSVLLLGAGPETPLLLDFMRRFGWSATIVEHRQRWSDFARAGIDDGAELVALAPGAAVDALRSRRFDAAIVMSHNYGIDLQHLRFCADGPAYVGLLGPIARRDALLAELGAAAERLRPRLHAPVGLDLGGSGPEAIALAIAAELQQFFAKR
jgi:xanthine dehydrogenase accessory factor